MALTVAVDLSAEDRRELESWTRASTLPAGLAQRARIVLLAGDGCGTGDIVTRTGASKPTVIQWKRRYAEAGIAGLDDRPRSGRPKELDEMAIVLATLEPPPAHLGVTHWSSRLLGGEFGISNVAVAKVWRDWGLQPWRTQTFKFSTDPELDTKVRDIVGLYLDPPENAVVVCIDEKSQIQALDRTAPILPIRPGLPEKATHDYVRHGTTTGQAARGVRQLRHPQTPRGKGLARAQPADHPALHPDLGVLAEHGGNLLRDHHPPGHPAWHTPHCSRPDRGDHGVHRWVERPLSTIRLDQG